MERTRTRRQISGGRGFQAFVQPIADAMGVAAAVAALIILIKAYETDSRGPVIEPDQGAHSLGVEDAPVRVLVFSDFKCPDCQTFALGPAQDIIEEFVARDRDKVRIVYAHTPVFGADSERAAVASECAARQGQFWAFHDSIFPDSQQAGTVTYQIAGLQTIATKIGLDVDKYSSCVNDPASSDAVKTSFTAAVANGVESSPTVFINERMLVGSRSYAEYRQVILEELSILD